MYTCIFVSFSFESLNESIYSDQQKDSLSEQSHSLLKSVSGIWTSLTWLNLVRLNYTWFDLVILWFGFSPKSIFATFPAASKNGTHFKTGQK